jgi:hypothetical protein
MKLIKALLATLSLIGIGVFIALLPILFETVGLAILGVLIFLAIFIYIYHEIQ